MLFRSEQHFRTNESNLQLGLDLANAYIAAQRIGAGTQVLDKIMASTQADISTLLSVAQTYAQMGDRVKVDAVLQKLQRTIPQVEAQFRANSNDVPLAFQIVSGYLVTQQTNRAVELTDSLVARPNADGSTFLSAAQVYAQVQDVAKLEKTLQKLIAAVPNHPEAWYDLSAVQITMGKSNEALASLRKSIELSDARLKAQPGSKDLRSAAATDLRFSKLQKNTDYQKLVKAK